MRALAVLMVVGVACAPEVTSNADLQYANVRAAYQTAPDSVLVFGGDAEQPYDVLGDLEVTVRQRGTFGESPSKELATRALREQAGRIGAHALVFVEFGHQGMSWWSNNELRGHGRAIRFR